MLINFDDLNHHKTILEYFMLELSNLKIKKDEKQNLLLDN